MTKKPSLISLVMVSLIIALVKAKAIVRPIPYSLSSAENFGKNYMDILESKRIRGKVNAIKWIENKGYNCVDSETAINLAISNSHSCITNCDGQGIFVDYEPDDTYTLYYVRSIIRIN